MLELNGLEIGLFIYYIELTSDLFERIPTINELLSELSQFNLNYMIVMLGQVNAVLYRDMPPTEEVHTELLRSFFTQEYLQQIIQNRHRLPDTTERPILFNSHHCIWLMRYASQVCKPKYGRRNTDTTQRKIGPLCLMANDFLSFERSRVRNSESPTDEQRRIELLTEFLPIREFLNHPKLNYAFARADIWFSDILPQIEGLGIDLEAEFLEITGMTFRQYLGFIFVMLAPYIRSNPPMELIQSLGSLFIQRHTYFNQTQISRSICQRFIDINSIHINDLPNAVYFNPLGSPAQYDFFIFKKFPFVELKDSRLICVHPVFLVEKITDGIYYTLLESFIGTDKEEALYTAWAKAFEEYVNRIFLEIYPPISARFNASPKFDNSNEEVADGLLDYGTDLVLFEYKSSRLTLNAKYSGNATALERELTSKFGRGSRSHKGVAQLARNIGHLFGLGGRSLKPFTTIDLSPVQRIYPVLIALDGNLGTSIMNWKLNAMFQSYIEEMSGGQIEIMPLIVVTIEDLELLAPNIQSGLSFLECLSRKCELDQAQNFTFQDFMRQNFYQDGSERNSTLEQRFDQVGQEITNDFMGESP